MENYKVIAIDLAKRNFHIVALNEAGKKVFAAKCGRNDLISTICTTFKKETKIAMEACGGSNYWARSLEKDGFSCLLLKTHDVKPYSKTRQKNDMNDALGIAKASLDPDLRPVQVKTLETQESCLVHRLRANTIKERVQKTNALMGLLHEFGFVSALSKKNFAKSARECVLEAFNEKKIGETSKNLFLVEAEEINLLLKKEKMLDRVIEEKNKTNEEAKILQTIPGIGPIISSIMTTLPIKSYDSGRDFAASLGLVPSQRTTGGVIQLGSISKKGSRYARTMLIQGARSILMNTSKGRGLGDALISWGYKLWKRIGFNKACVALANKLARICYACLNKNASYKTRSLIVHENLSNAPDNCDPQGPQFLAKS